MSQPGSKDVLCFLDSCSGCLNGKTLNYIYDGEGSKRSMNVSGLVITYEGAFEYDGGGSLQRIATDEGQLIRSGGNWAWQYYLKDRLGNVRVVMDENGNAIHPVVRDVPKDHRERSILRVCDPPHQPGKA